MKRKLMACIAVAANVALLCMASPGFASGELQLTTMTERNPTMEYGNSTWSTSVHDMIMGFRENAGEYYDEVGFSSNRYEYTQDELMTLAKVIHLEVRGEPYVAMLAVGNVVMNRVLSPGYPGKTIEAVVSRPNQFCYNPSVKPMAKCVQAARDVLQNEKWVIPQDIYFFRAVKTRANWGRHEYYKHIGNTAFYKDTYSGRANNKPVPAALYQRVYEWPQYGCKPGLRVVKLQNMLDGLGYKVGSDGYFDADTRDALIRFQENEGADASGVADPSTLSRLIAKNRSKNPLWIMH